MKKYFILILAVVLLTACVGCQKNYNSYNTSDEIKNVNGYIEPGDEVLGFRCEYDENTGTLTIIGKGDMPVYDEEFKFACPWNFEPNGYENPKNIVISDGITSISESAFATSYDGNSGEPRDNMYKIETVTMSDSVTEIGDYAFFCGESLKSVKLSENINTLGDCCFSDCRFLSEIELPKALEQVSWGAFGYCTGLKNVSFNSGLKTIDEYAFSGCSKLKTLNLPDTLEKICSDAFNSVPVSRIDFPKSLKVIESYAFYGCNQLEEIVFNEGIKTIGDHAFYKCNNLSSVTIPKSVEEIGEYAFGYKEKTSGEYLIEDINNNFTIKGYKGTAAEQYAKENNFNFAALD